MTLVGRSVDRASTRELNAFCSSVSSRFQSCLQSRTSPDETELQWRHGRGDAEFDHGDLAGQSGRAGQQESVVKCSAGRLGRLVCIMRRDLQKSLPRRRHGKTRPEVEKLYRRSKATSQLQALGDASEKCITGCAPATIKTLAEALEQAKSMLQSPEGMESESPDLLEALDVPALKIQLVEDAIPELLSFLGSTLAPDATDENDTDAATLVAAIAKDHRSITDFNITPSQDLTKRSVRSNLLECEAGREVDSAKLWPLPPLQRT